MKDLKTYRFYGRRAGRKLRPARQELVANFLPELSFTLTPALDPASLFDKRRTKFFLEIGFGGGEHLAWRAQQNPEAGLIGSEMFINGISSLLSDIKKKDLSNIRIYPGDARELLVALKSQSIRQCFLLFPDPWPKYRHWNRRIIKRETLDNIARILEPGGELIVATDDPSYLLWILHHMQGHSSFFWEANKFSDWETREWSITRYEQKALKAGRKAYFLYYRKQEI